MRPVRRFGKKKKKKRKDGDYNGGSSTCGPNWSVPPRRTELIFGASQAPFHVLRLQGVADAGLSLCWAESELLLSISHPTSSVGSTSGNPCRRRIVSLEEDEQKNMLEIIPTSTDDSPDYTLWNQEPSGGYTRWQLEDEKDVPATLWQVPTSRRGGDPGGEQSSDGVGVLDTGATASVTSLKALDYLVSRRYQLFGEGDHVQVVPGPAKNFRFGNASTQVSESFVLLSQRLGNHVVSVGLYTIDATGLPLLLGIRTLEKLGAVIDCSRAAMVLKTIDDTLVIPLKRSSAGHLLLDMCSSDWLRGGAKVLYAETPSMEKEKCGTSATAYVVPGAENLEGSTSCAPARPCLTCTVDVAHELSSAEWQCMSSVPSESLGEWLADVFAVRHGVREPTSPVAADVSASQVCE